jgi:hypothetical protein
MKAIQTPFELLQIKDWGCGSVGEYLPSTHHEDLIPSPVPQKKKKKPQHCLLQKTAMRLLPHILTPTALFTLVSGYMSDFADHHSNLNTE